MSTEANTADSQTSTEAGAVPTPRERTREQAQPKRPSTIKRLGEGAAEPLVIFGEIVQLGFKVFYMAITKPYGYWGEARDQAYEALKLCWFPAIVSSFAFGFGAPGLSGGAIFSIFCIPSRLGGFFVFASLREFAPFVTGMVVAGVVGTAVTADLGARRIREELDAMEVLGVDPIRTLVVPRVLAVTFMTTILCIVTFIMGVLSGYVAAILVFGGRFTQTNYAMVSLLNLPDVYAAVGKGFLFGLVLSVVCCYMGLNVKGGSIGVGKAVNQAVVIAFAGVWVVNFVYTALLLGLSPTLYVFK